MSKAGKKIIRGMNEALAFARGEQPVPRITIRGHAYVPEAAVAAERERCAKIAEDAPKRVLVMYDRPGGPPGNTYVHISGQKLIASMIRRQGDHQQEAKGANATK